MARTECPTTAEIEALLARVSAAGISPARACQQPAVEDAIALLADCIQNTVLFRRLTLEADGSECFSILAGKGHAFTLTALGNHAASVDHPGKIPQQLTAADIDTFGNLICRTTEGATTIRVLSAIANETPTLSQAGISAAQLLAHFGLEIAHLSSTELIDAFEAAIEELWLAVFREADGGWTCRQGFEPSAAVKARVDGVLEASEAIRDTCGTTSLLLFPDSDPEAPVIALHPGKNAEVVFVLEPGTAGDVATLWADMSQGVLLSHDPLGETSRCKPCEHGPQPVDDRNGVSARG